MAPVVGTGARVERAALRCPSLSNVFLRDGFAVRLYVKRVFTAKPLHGKTLDRLGHLGHFGLQAFYNGGGITMTGPHTNGGMHQ